MRHHTRFLILAACLLFALPVSAEPQQGTDCLSVNGTEDLRNRITDLMLYGVPIESAAPDLQEEFNELSRQCMIGHGLQTEAQLHALLQANLSDMVGDVLRERIEETDFDFQLLFGLANATVSEDENAQLEMERISQEVLLEVSRVSALEEISEDELKKLVANYVVARVQEHMALAFIASR